MDDAQLPVPTSGEEGEKDFEVIDPIAAEIEERASAKRTLTPNIRKKMEGIILALRAGNYIETAAAFQQVPRSTIREWLKKGASESSRGLYRWFHYEVEKAWAEAEMRDVMAIGQAIKDGQWTAAAWRLERKFPDRWGKTTKVDMRTEVLSEHTEKRVEEHVVKFVIEDGEGNKIAERIMTQRGEELLANALDGEAVSEPHGEGAEGTGI